MAFKSSSTPTTGVNATTETTVYNGTGSGAPAAGAVVIGLVATNIGSVSANIDIYKRPYGNTFGTGDVYIVKGVVVPVGSSLDALPNKLVLNSGDNLYMQTSVANAIQVTVSLLEN